MLAIFVRTSNGYRVNVFKCSRLTWKLLASALGGDDIQLDIHVRMCYSYDFKEPGLYLIDFNGNILKKR